MKYLSLLRSTVLAFAMFVLAPLLHAAEVNPLPLLVAESESFEVVGRLEEAGLVFHVDRADSNAPVLGATLDVEQAGRTARAVFRPAYGDYLLSDAEWLAAVRQPGDYPLGLTLIAGEESDLLSGDLHVFAVSTAESDGRSVWPLWVALAAVLAGLAFRRRQQGGAA